MRAETSLEALDSVREQFPRLQGQVYYLILNAGAHGATDDEIEYNTGLRHQTASARRRELVILGKIKDSGRRRLTRSGRRATVWIVDQLPLL
jgi:hypothetical protein